MIVGQTLSPGGIVTVSGTAISYVAAWAVVVVGTSTEGCWGGSGEEMVGGGFGGCGGEMEICGIVFGNEIS